MLLSVRRDTGAMTEREHTLTVGGICRQELREQLTAAGVGLNAFAETLLEHPRVQQDAPVALTLTQRTVEELGLPAGGTLPQVIAAARQHGLELCPPATGPYLRLALTSQTPAPDSVLSAGRLPTGALHVLSVPLGADHDDPKGFYLRVVDGVSWLRGFRCDDDYVWAPESVIALRGADGS